MFQPPVVFSPLHQSVATAFVSVEKVTVFDEGKDEKNERGRLMKGFHIPSSDNHVIAALLEFEEMTEALLGLARA